MKILLHGSTNNGSIGTSNYGDFIYGQQIYEYFSKKGHEVSFYRPSDFFKKYVYNGKENSVGFANADLFVYFPGGYFGEGPFSSPKVNFTHFRRFMLPGLTAVLSRIPVIVAGIGAGPVKSPFFSWPIRYIGKHSEFITTRDHESYEALVNLGLKNVTESSDMILSMNIVKKDLPDNTLGELHRVSQGKKILLVHYNHAWIALEKFAGAVKSFVGSHPDFFAVVASDSILPFENGHYERFRKLSGIESFHYLYDNPFEFSSLIGLADVVLTCKLHVGVVAAMLGKPVVSIADHYEKTSRFYRQIGESRRCVPLSDCGEAEIEELLNRYHTVPVRIPEEVVELSRVHWKKIDESVSRIQNV